MWLAGRLILLVVGLLLINFQLAIRQGEFAAPMSVTLDGFSDSELRSARLHAVYFGWDQVIAPTRAGSWDLPPRCVIHVVLEFSTPPKMNSVVCVAIDDEIFGVPLHEFELRDGRYWLPENVRLGDPPAIAPCRNWPGMQAFVIYYCTRTAPGLLAVLFLVAMVAVGMREPFRSRVQAMLGVTETPGPTACIPSWDRGWNVAGWLGLIGGFIGLEVMQPYYFTQDDALVGELPGILLGCRSLWQGTFPDWNPYVFLGAPLATIGFWAITYPPQLLSYAIARHLLGNEFATMEVFAALHLVVGFWAMRHLCRRIGMGAMPANLAALSFVFAGCILIMGRSWHAFIANAVWLPLLGIAIQRFREGPVGWKWIVGVGLVLGLSYHAGFPQIVAILGIFFVLGLGSVMLGRDIPWLRLAVAAPAVLLGIGLSAPLLLHHLQMTGSLERSAPAENGIYDELHGALFPYPLAETGLPTAWGSFHVEKMGHFYFFGGLFALLFAMQMAVFWLCFPDRAAWSRSWWVPCGIFALLMVLGEPAYLWRGMAALPMSKFFLRYSFRFYPCLAFCAVLSGGLVLERLLTLLRRRALWETLLGAALLGVLAYHLAMCQASFYSYGFRPYPKLPADFEATFHPYDDPWFVGAKNSRRLVSWSQMRSPAPDFYLALPLNLPHYYQVPSILGYDPVTEGQARVAEVYRRLEADPVAACKAYGVGWHLFSYSETPVVSPNKQIFELERAIPFEPAYRRLLKADLKPLAHLHNISLKELPGVDPLAFVTGRPELALPLHLHCRGADLDVTGLPAGTPVTVNFLWYPQMSLALDGQPVDVTKDDWQRIAATLPQSGSTLSLRFEPPWLRTAAIGAAMCLGALLLGWITLRFGEKNTSKECSEQ